MNGRYTDPTEMAATLPRTSPPTQGQVARARVVVASNATSVGECRDLLDMLGIGPGLEVLA